MFLKQPNTSSWTFEIEEMSNFIEINDYFTLQVGVTLGSLGSRQATRLVTPMIAICFVETFLLLPDTEQLWQINKAFVI